MQNNKQQWAQIFLKQKHMQNVFNDFMAKLQITLQQEFKFNKE